MGLVWRRGPDTGTETWSGRRCASPARGADLPAGAPAGRAHRRGAGGPGRLGRERRVSIRVRSSRRRGGSSTPRPRSRRPAAWWPEGRAAGARLILLPEAFVRSSRAPAGARLRALGAGGDRSSSAASTTRRSRSRDPHRAPGEAARAAGAWGAIGVQRAQRRPRRHALEHAAGPEPAGRGRDRHRKLLPTMQERVFWPGARRRHDRRRDRLREGRRLLCWENFMPAPAAASTRGRGLLSRPTADTGSSGRPRCAPFAFEAGAFVLSSCQYLRRDDFRQTPDARPPRALPGGPESPAAASSSTRTAPCWPARSGTGEILIADCDSRRRSWRPGGSRRRRHYERPTSASDRGARAARPGPPAQLSTSSR